LPLFGCGCLFIMALVMLLPLAAIGLLDDNMGRMLPAFAALILVFMPALYVLALPIVVWRRRRFVKQQGLLRDLQAEVGGELREPGFPSACRYRLWCTVDDTQFEVIHHLVGARRFRAGMQSMAHEKIRSAAIDAMTTEHAQLTSGPRLQLDVHAAIDAPYDVVVAARSRMAGRFTKLEEVASGDAPFDERILVQAGDSAAMRALLDDESLRAELRAAVEVNGPYMCSLRLRARPKEHQPSLTHQLEVRPEVTGVVLAEQLARLVRISRRIARR